MQIQMLIYIYLDTSVKIYFHQQVNVDFVAAELGGVVLFCCWV